MLPKKIVRAAIFDGKRHGILFLGPPACATSEFIKAVLKNQLVPTFPVQANITPGLLQ
jgi:hypothetical protein